MIPHIIGHCPLRAMISTGALWPDRYAYVKSPYFGARALLPDGLGKGFSERIFSPKSPYHTTSVKGHDQSGKTFGISNDIVDEIFVELSCVIVQKFILFGKRRFPNFIT